MTQLNAGRGATHQPRHDGVNTEARIRSERPLERLIAIDTGSDGSGAAEGGGLTASPLELRFTGTPITRAIGKAIEAPFSEQGAVLRCHWERN